MKTREEIYAELVKKYSLTKQEFWKTQDGVWVIRSSGLRRIADVENVICETDVTITALTSGSYVALAKCKAYLFAREMRPVTCHGSADDNSCKKDISRAYKAEMAEKRAVDRAVIKLLGMDGIYSDVEAETFQRAPSATISSVKEQK